ncbi:MAG: porin family protein [Flavitalea sp.]
MKKLILYLLVLIPNAAFSQFGIRAGYNFARVSGASSINSNSRSGFNAGVLLAPPSQSIISSRTELTFSKQGYDYKSNTNTGTVNLNYLQFGQLMSVNLTKYISILLGAHTAYLLNGSVDSVAANGSGNSPGNSLLSLYNRFDYGYGVGAEVHPFNGLLIGARYNVSLNKLYQSVQSGQLPSFTSEDAKNNVVQLYVGWIFGNSSGPKNKKE